MRTEPELRVSESQIRKVVIGQHPIYQEWVAQLNGPTNADITPNVQGYLLSQNYENGYFVKKGQLLYTIDLRSTDGAQAESPFAVLGPGDFLGEATPHHGESHLSSIRARIVVRVLTMSRGRILEPVPPETLKPDNTLEQAMALLIKSSNGFLFILDDQERLWGVSNSADLTLAAQMIAYKQTVAPEEVKNVKLREFVSTEPVIVSSDDSSLFAATTMLEHGLTWIPVIASKTDHHLKGYVRMEK